MTKTKIVNGAVVYADGFTFPIPQQSAVRAHEWTAEHWDKWRLIYGSVPFEAASYASPKHDEPNLIDGREPKEYQSALEDYEPVETNY